MLLVGAPPGAGKTALVLQLGTGVLHHNADVRAVVGNVEMAPEDLLARVAARLAGVPLDHVTDKTFAPGERDRLKAALADHAGLFDRLAFLEPPFALDHLAATLDAFRAKVAVVDYVQRFGRGGDLRETLDGLMSGLRALARAGAAVIAVSSVSRQRTPSGGSTYDGLTLASFRGSAELEFGADSAYLLDSADGVATLRCVKNRYGKPADVPLRFDGALQEFSPGDPPGGFDTVPGRPTNGKGKR